MTPIQLLMQWIEEENGLGAQYAQHAVLSTHGLNGQPGGRIVAIREITAHGIILFTQMRTRKVEEIKHNNKVTLTFWFERHAREIIIEGDAYFLSQKQNIHYWDEYPQRAQIRFCTYAPTSGLAIENKKILEDKRREIEQAAKQHPLPCSPDYCGVVIKPKRFVFYTYRLDELSDVWEYQINGQGFIKKILSP